MDAILTLFPVFVMMGLGTLCRAKNFITPTQKEGIRALTFDILFPVLVFSVIVSAEFHLETLFVVIFNFLWFCFTPIAGKRIGKLIKLDYPHFSHYLLTTCEGGNLVLPLYIAAVGSEHASNVVLIDLAGMFIAFIVVPAMVIRDSSGEADIKALVKKVVRDRFIIAVMSALVLNLSGAFNFLQSTPVFPFYESAISYLTMPITSLILFVVGYDLKPEMKMLPTLFKLILLRAGLYAFVIGLYFVIFRSLMADRMFMIAAILYFTATTGFAVLLQIKPLYKSEEESYFASSFVSTYIVLELIVYVMVVVFMV